MSRYDRSRNQRRRDVGDVGQECAVALLDLGEFASHPDVGVHLRDGMDGTSTMGVSLGVSEGRAQTSPLARSMATTIEADKRITRLILLTFPMPFLLTLPSTVLCQVTLRS
jgi:hypothetical protein